MATPATLALWLSAALALGALATWLARRYALRRQLIDLPGERRSHRAATPRGGGVSIVLVLLLAHGALVLAWPAAMAPILLAAGGLALVAGVGWIDDHRPLSPWLRLCVHAVAAVALAAALAAAGGSGSDMAIAFAATLALTNVWNFMDGIDGLAASQAVVVATAYALLAGHGPVLWLGLALAAAACGFLPFNFPRARIFLGDVGSGAIGYALAALLAMSATGQSPEVRLPLLFPLLPFLLDASLTLLSRMVRGEAWWQAHVQHAYQAWARHRGSHVGVTLAYAAAAVVAATIMFAVRSWSCGIIIAVYATFVLAGWVAWRLLRGRDARARAHGFEEGKP